MLKLESNYTGNSILTEKAMLDWCDRLDEEAEYIKQVANQIRVGILYGDTQTKQEVRDGQEANRS